MSCRKKIDDGVYHESPVNFWFELTYAQYLTVPRSILEEMPLGWQEDFVRLMNELDETFDWRPEYPLRYWVKMRDMKTGRFVSLGENDPLMEYRYNYDNVNARRKNE